MLGENYGAIDIISFKSFHGHDHKHQVYHLSFNDSLLILHDGRIFEIATS